MMSGEIETNEKRMILSYDNARADWLMQAARGPAPRDCCSLSRLDQGWGRKRAVGWCDNVLARQ